MDDPVVTALIILWSLVFLGFFGILIAMYWDFIKTEHIRKQEERRHRRGS